MNIIEFRWVDFLVVGVIFFIPALIFKDKKKSQNLGGFNDSVSPLDVENDVLLQSKAVVIIEF